MNQYGIDINKLQEFITAPHAVKEAWGRRSVVVSLPEYELQKLEIDGGKTCHFAAGDGREATVFAEDGSVEADGEIFGRGETLTLRPGEASALLGRGGAVLYVFSGPGAPAHAGAARGKIFDHREKYWGSIETIVSKDYAGKRLVCGKDKSGSLEFHCRKKESYFIHSGRMLVRLRAGRGEDRFFEMPAGKAIFLPPGLMHQRGALEDSVIIEISTRDEDADSFLVEDGVKRPMPNFPR